MKALLHCGTLKTGSTSVQNTAWSNRQELARQGILYPETGIDPRASKEQGEIGFRHSRFVDEFGKDTYSSLIDNLHAELGASKAHTVLISSEQWSKPGAAVSIRALAAHLGKADVDDIHGLVFIRNARDYITRHYREWVRRYGISLPFQQYVISRRHCFDYLTLCRNIQDAFHDKVTFVSYDGTADVTGYLFEHLQVDSSQFRKPAKNNAGLSCLDTEIIRLLNQYGLRVGRLPEGREMLDQFGLQASVRPFQEALPDGFLDVYDPRYVREFSKLTGISSADSKALFKDHQPAGINIAEVSPILERLVFEWLKKQRAA